MPHTFDATAEASCIAELPLAGGLFRNIRWQTANKEGRIQSHILVLAFVNHRAGIALIHSKSEILFLRQELDSVVPTVRHCFIAKHVGDGIVAHVVADADSTSKQLDGNVLRFPIVDENAVLLFSRENHGDVRLRLRLEWRHLNVGAVLCEADSRQEFAPLPCKERP